jgi:ATP/maltotriose-dependent transcriptional regulator MalT
LSQDVDPIDRAREAFAAERWSEAYEAFGAATELRAADLEAQADAAWWASRLGPALEIRQRAYAAYVAEGDELAAAAVAVRVAIDHFLWEEASVGAGFLMRARRHLAEQPETTTHGYLALVEGAVARFTGDMDGAVEHARRALEIGRRFGDRDLVAMAIHVEGQAHVGAGRIVEGLSLLDEAMAAVVVGDVSPYYTGVIYCAVIQTCLELGDIRRAGEWSDAARAWCESLTTGSPFLGMCRVNRAEVTRLRGAWTEAEAEALLAADELMGIAPGFAAAAFVQLGEVRRRVGDLGAAAAAFERGKELGLDPQPGLALVRLAQRKVDAAASALRLALEADQEAPVRTRLLAAQVEVAVAAGDLATGRAAAAALAAIAADIELPLFAASAAEAEGRVAIAAGEPTEALGAIRRAVDAWQRCRLPYEAARARALLGAALLANGDEDDARLELRAAAAAFERLGAVPDAAAATELLRDPSGLPGGLTARECEVLQLVAAGKTNRDIAVALVISEHTVARHLQNMFAKLGVSSRSAATAYAFEHDLA